MSVTMNVSAAALDELQRLIEANPSVAWRTVALDPAVVATLDWGALDRDALMPVVKAYQRLIRVLPAGEEPRALPLLASGLHSALQIASLPRDEWAGRWESMFPGEAARGRAVHDAALRRRSDLLLHHLHDVQRNEPHYRAARFK